LDVGKLCHGGGGRTGMDRNLVSCQRAVGVGKVEGGGEVEERALLGQKGARGPPNQSRRGNTAIFQGIRKKKF